MSLQFKHHELSDQCKPSWSCLKKRLFCLQQQVFLFLSQSPFQFLRKKSSNSCKLWDQVAKLYIEGMMVFLLLLLKISANGLVRDQVKTTEKVTLISTTGNTPVHICNHIQILVQRRPQTVFSISVRTQLHCTLYQLRIPAFLNRE